MLGRYADNAKPFNKIILQYLRHENSLIKHIKIPSQETKNLLDKILNAIINDNYYEEVKYLCKVKIFIMLYVNVNSRL